MRASNLRILPPARLGIRAFVSASLIILLTSSVSSAQQQDTTKYLYCELVGTAKFLSNKVTIKIDFGEERAFLGDNRLRDEQTGRVKVFNSMVDALNYMGNDGWEFVQAYVVTVGQQNVYHWLLKRRRYFVPVPITN